MHTEPELVMALLADARLPTGGHAHSAGLEPAIAAGLTTAGVPGFIRTRLRTVGATEAATAVVARRVWLDAGDLAPVEAAWAARTPSAAMRATARRLGRGYLRLAARLWPDVAKAFDRADPPRAVVIGVIGAVTGLSARQIALLVGHDEAQTIASAALKLLPMDPVDAARWVLDAQGDVTELAERIETCADPGDIPALNAPMLDVHAETHARTTRRLFHA
ncbi:MAG: urease accessory protein UreF [Aeromicrobium sp.]